MNEMIQLLNGALQGETRAFDRLYELTHQKAYYVALRYMKDEHQAEDVLQEAYIKAFNNLDTLQNANKFEPWLHKIVYTTAMDVYRKRKRQAERSINFSDYEGENETTIEFEDDREEFRPEEQIDYQETQKAVLSFIDELSSSQRMTMMLFYYEQYSLKEIAEVMECSIGTVKSRLNKAKQLMRGMVNGYEKKHGVALHALPLFPFFAWAFKNAAETSTVHAAPMAYTATAAKNIATQQAKEKVIEKTVAQKAVINLPKAAAKKVVIGVITAGVAGGTIFGARYVMQQKQQARIESQQAKKRQQEAKKKEETKTERQKMLEAYGKYLEDMDEETRFYIADIAENQNPVLLIGTPYKIDNSWGEVILPQGYTQDDELCETYDIYNYQNGTVTNITEDENGGMARGLYLTQKDNEKYILTTSSTGIECVGISDNKVKRYTVSSDRGEGDTTLYIGTKLEKDWKDASKEEIKQLFDSFANYDTPIQFYKNTKENREQYCK